jgi:hypothetical protein
LFDADNYSTLSDADDEVFVMDKAWYDAFVIRTVVLIVDTRHQVQPYNLHLVTLAVLNDTATANRKA